MPYQIVEGEGDLQLNVNPELLLRINCALTEVITNVLFPLEDTNEIIRILKESFEFLTQFSGLSFANDTFMNWVFGFDDCRTGDDMDTEELSIVDHFLNEFRKKLSEMISGTYNYYVCASGLISPEYIIELQRRTQFLEESTESSSNKSDWSLKSNEWFNTIISLYEPYYILVIQNILDTVYAEYDTSLTDNQLRSLSSMLKGKDHDACNWHRPEMIAHITKYIVDLQ